MKREMCNAVNNLGVEVDTFNPLEKFLHLPGATIAVNLNFKNMRLQNNKYERIYLVTKKKTADDKF